MDDPEIEYGVVGTVVRGDRGHISRPEANPLASTFESLSRPGDHAWIQVERVHAFSAEQVEAIEKNPGLHLRADDYEPPENAKKEPSPIKQTVLDKRASEEVKAIGKQLSEEIMPALKELAERVDASDAAIKAFADLADVVEKLDKRVSKLEK